MSPDPMNCPNIPICIIYLVVLQSPTTVSITFKSRQMPQLICQLLLRLRVLRAKDRNVLCHLLYSAAAAKVGSHRSNQCLKRNESRPCILVLSWEASKFSTFLSPYAASEHQVLGLPLQF
jgi:hypothetical protein